MTAGGPNFNLQGSETLSGGATVSTRQWTVQAGTAVTLANASTQTVTVTPPASGGTTTTLRYTVTGSPGSLSSFDDVVITWESAASGAVTATEATIYRVNATTTTPAVTITQTSGPTLTVTEPTPKIFEIAVPVGLSTPAVFSLTATGLTAKTVTVSPFTAAAGGLLEERIADATGWGL